MEFVIVFIIVVVAAVIIALINSFNNPAKQRVQDENRRRNARNAVDRSNENLSNYIAFLQEHEPTYGKPDKVLGANNMHFLYLQDEGEQLPDLSSKFPNPYGIKCEAVAMKWATMSAYMLSVSFPKLEDIVIIYGDAKMIAMKGKLYEFSDVLSYEVLDNSKQVVVGNKVVSTTKTNTGSMVGRGIVGGLVGGTAGAVIGASTASKTTTTNTPNQKVVTKHDYSVYVSVRDLANPMLKFNYGSEADLVQEFVAILNIILS